MPQLNTINFNFVQTGKYFSFAGQDNGILFFHPALTMSLISFSTLKDNLEKNGWKLNKSLLIFYKNR